MTREALGPHIPWGIFSIVLAGTFLGPFGGIIVAVALPTISSEFGIGLQDAKWVLLVYQVCTTFLLPVMGRLGQRFGEGRLFALGFAVDGIGTLGSALVPEGQFWLLIVTRVLQAIGSAFLFALFSAVVARFVPPAKRGLAFGLIGATVAISLVLAPLLGGILCAQLGWRWVFLIQLPLQLFGLLRCLQLLPRDAVQEALPLPWLNTGLWLLLVSGLILSSEGLERGWSARLMLPAAVLTIAAIAGFAAAERSGSSLLHYALFRLRAFWLGAAGMLALNLTFAAMILLIPFYLEDQLGYSARQSGMLLSLSPLATLFLAPLGGAWADRRGPRWPALCGFVAAMAGFTLLAGPGVAGDMWLLGAGLVLLGVAGGLFNGPVIAAMMAAAGQEQRSHASSTNSLARNLGFLFGTALCSLTLVWLLRSADGGSGAGLDIAAVPLEQFRQAAAAVFAGCAVLSAVLAVLYWGYPNEKGTGHPASDG